MVIRDFTALAQKAINQANDDALECKNDHISTEHLLSGIMKVGGIATQTTRGLGIQSITIYQEIRRVNIRGKETPKIDKLQFAPRSKLVIEQARVKARVLESACVGTHHLLLALVRVKEGPAAEVLKKIGITDIEVVRKKIINLREISPLRTDGQIFEDVIKRINPSANDGSKDLLSIVDTHIKAQAEKPRNRFNTDDLEDWLERISNKLMDLRTKLRSERDADESQPAPFSPDDTPNCRGCGAKTVFRESKFVCLQCSESVENVEDTRSSTA